jgi:hypothetical protein
MDVKTFVKKKTKTIEPKAREELMRKLRKENETLVKGKFEFLDAQGGWIEFNYRFFPEDLLTTYRFVHGEVCEIPMGLVKHLNNTVKKVRKFGVDQGDTRGNLLPDRGLPSSYDITSRVRFTPIDMF